MKINRLFLYFKCLDRLGSRRFRTCKCRFKGFFCLFGKLPFYRTVIGSFSGDFVICKLYLPAVISAENCVFYSKMYCVKNALFVGEAHLGF